MKKTISIILSMFMLFIASAVTTEALDEIGRVVALKGRATIERNKKLLETKIKDGILLIDTVATKEASRTKMLFVDDSVLTIGENTKVVIKEFVYSKDERGRSIFNLIDGRMRAVVGKSNLEVYTPTVVTAARGTVIYFETGEKDGKKYTIVISLKGQVDVSSIDPTVTGTVVLGPGMMITVEKNVPLPVPVIAPKEAIQAAGMSKEMMSAKSDSMAEIAETLKAATLAPKIEQQPQVQGKNPIGVGIVFP